MPTATPTTITPPYQPTAFERPKDIVQRTRLARSVVYDVIRSGRVPSQRVGKAVLVPVGAFDAFMSQETERARQA